MSTAAVSSGSLPPQATVVLSARQSDLQQLGQALQSGDTAAAQQEFSAIRLWARAARSRTETHFCQPASAGFQRHRAGPAKRRPARRAAGLCPTGKHFQAGTVSRPRRPTVGEPERSSASSTASGTSAPCRVLLRAQPQARPDQPADQKSCSISATSLRVSRSRSA
jgi:hypothetical protein